MHGTKELSAGAPEEIRTPDPQIRSLAYMQVAVGAAVGAATRGVLNVLCLQDVTCISGGESGIRTHGTVSRTHAFQACALSHSAISPEALS